jgi:hypothetical protein
MSSSESEEEEALRHPVLARPAEAILEEFRDLMSQPLTDLERQNLLWNLEAANPYTPGPRFLHEAKHEHGRLTAFWRSEDPNSRSAEFLNPRKKEGMARREVLVRRNIRKRWERLGIWNPAWGIPGRVNKQPSDDTETWRWRWQPSEDLPSSDPQHLHNRAVQLRTNLSYEEHVLPPPRSHLQSDATAPEAESFIISRPWFTYFLERLELHERRRRIPVAQLVQPGVLSANPVRKRWEEMGDWKEGWAVPGYPDDFVVGWKWRHESPSPEPENLTQLNTDDMDFTPSEVDALEAIPPDSPPKPAFWNPRTSSSHGPEESIGQLNGEAEEPVALGFDNDAQSGARGLFSGLFYKPRTVQNGFEASDEVLPPEYESRNGYAAEDDPIPHAEAEDDLMPDAKPQSPLPPPRRRGRPRKQPQPVNGGASVPPPTVKSPIRRSARIIAMRATLQPEPQQPEVPQPTRTRRPRGPPAAPPPPPSRSAARATVEEPKRKRGRPRKTQDGGIQKPATAPAQKKGRKPSRKTVAALEAAVAPVVVGDGGRTRRKSNKTAPAPAVPVIKRGRGRPRKTG